MKAESKIEGERDMRMSDLFLALQEAEDVRTITIHPWVVKLLGGIKETVFFTNICQWIPGTNRTKEIYKTMEDMENETGLTLNEQKTARQKLVALGVLKERHARLEHKLYFSLDLDGIERLIENSESDKPSSPKAGTQLSRKLESNFRESDKAHFDIRNKRVTGELQESCNKEEAQAPLVLPGWLNLQTWSDFKEMRKKIRKPMTLAAEVLAVKRLTALKNEGQDPQQVMEQSILNSWQSFYPVRRDNGRQAEGDLNERTKRILRRGL